MSTVHNASTVASYVSLKGLDNDWREWGVGDSPGDAPPAVLDLFDRQDSWALEEDGMLTGGMDGWQLLPLAEENCSSLAEIEVYGLESEVQSAVEAKTEVRDHRAAVESAVQDVAMQDSFDQHTSWLDKVMLGELGALATPEQVCGSAPSALIASEPHPPGTLKESYIDFASFGDGNPCIDLATGAELDDLVAMMLAGPTAPLTPAQPADTVICSPTPADNWPWCQTNEAETSCDNSEASYSDSSSDEEFTFSRGAAKGRRRKPTKRVKRCGVSREEYARLSRDERRERKKEQNKNAATKYREKKRVEEIEKETMCEALERRNAELRKEVADKEQEVKMLRKLVINIFRPAATEKKNKSTRK